MPNEIEPGSNTPETENDSAPTGQPDIGAMVNAAVKNHLSRFAKNELPAMFGEALKPFTEQFAKFQAPKEEPVKEGKASPEIAALMRANEEIRKAYDSEKAERLATEKRAREERAFGDFKGQLAKGVRPDMLDIVARDIFHNQKLVNVNEDGSVTFKGTQSAYGMTSEVEFPLGAGVDSWLKSEAAKPFLPAPSVSTTPPNPSQRRLVTPGTSKGADPAKMSDRQKASLALDRQSELEALAAAKNISFD